jgi:hypothetical protein
MRIDQPGIGEQEDVEFALSTALFGGKLGIRCCPGGSSKADRSPRNAQFAFPSVRAGLVASASRHCGQSSRQGLPALDEVRVPSLI